MKPIIVPYLPRIMLPIQTSCTIFRGNGTLKMTRDLGIKFDSPPKWVPFNDPSWAKRSVLNKKTRGERVKSSEAKKKERNHRFKYPFGPVIRTSLVFFEPTKRGHYITNPKLYTIFRGNGTKKNYYIDLPSSLIPSKWAI